jgi:hypothetical protein
MYRTGFAGGSGDGGRAGVCLQGSRVGEAGGIVAEFGEQAAAGQRAESGKAGDDLGVIVLVEGFDGRVRKLVGDGAGGVELQDQRLALSAEPGLRLLRVTHLRGAKDVMEPVNPRFDVAAASRLDQQSAQLWSKEGGTAAHLLDANGIDREGLRSDLLVLLDHADSGKSP